MRKRRTLAPALACSQGLTSQSGGRDSGSGPSVSFDDPLAGFSGGAIRAEAELAALPIGGAEPAEEEEGAVLGINADDAGEFHCRMR